MTRSLIGAPVADALFSACQSRIAAGQRAGWRAPTLVSLHQGSPTPFSVYLRQQARGAARAGIQFREERFEPAAGARVLAERVAALNDDPGVHAVLLEHPLPTELAFAGAVGCLRFEKDVDGVGVTNLGRSLGGELAHVPAVARAARSIAGHYAIPIQGQHVGVVGRSPTVGLPLAVLLAGHHDAGNATVTVAHRGTSDLAAALHGASVIFACAGQPGLLNRQTVPKGAAIIDVGLSTIPDAAAPNGRRLVGDADAADMDGWAKALTPVPGGVGPVTVAQLMANTVDAWSWLEGASRP